MKFTFDMKNGIITNEDAHKSVNIEEFKDLKTPHIIDFEKVSNAFEGKIDKIKYINNDFSSKQMRWKQIFTALYEATHLNSKELKYIVNIEIRENGTVFFKNINNLIITGVGDNGVKLTDLDGFNWISSAINNKIDGITCDKNILITFAETFNSKDKAINETYYICQQKIDDLKKDCPNTIFTVKPLEKSTSEVFW